MSDPVFVDTWAWIALGHRRDARHEDVKRCYESLRQSGTAVYTSDYVLDEVITLLFRREVFAEALGFVQGVLAAAEAGAISIEPVGQDLFAKAWNLRQRFQDKPLISFTDLTSMALMQSRGLRRIVTDDQHFAQVGMGFQLLP